MTALKIETTDEQLGVLLRAMRKVKRLTQSEVADAIGVARTTICNMETGASSVLMHHLVAAADHMGYDIVMTIRPRPKPAEPIALP